MSLLPTLGADYDTWGAKINAFLKLFANDADGTLKTSAVQAAVGGPPLVVLTWDVGTSDYLPTGSKAAAQVKEFRGPTDPATVTGVVLHPFDVWVSSQ